MYDFIAIDFETATTDMNSACSIGIACVSNFKVVDTKYFLIQPPNNKYLAQNISIHGITPEMTADSPKFDSLWSNIQELFKDCIVVAHNVRFDLSVLRSCLDTYSLHCDDFQYIDSIAVSNRAISDKNLGQSLVERAAYFNIPIEEHHNALSDAITCAEIVIASVKTTNRKSLKTYCSSYRSRTTHLFSELKPMTKMPSRPAWKDKKSKPADISPSVPITDTSHPFYGKNIVLTGDLTTMIRSDAMQRISDVGGILKSGVSSKVDYVIVGKQDVSVVGADGMSTKERKAHELIENGSSLKILNEHEFIELLG